LEDILRSFYQHGFRRVMIVNGHGGNTASITSTIQTIAPELPGQSVKLFEWWKDAEAYRVVIETMGEQAGSHASFGETALMLAIHPDAVKLENLTGNDAPMKNSREMLTIKTFSQQYPDGIIGLDPGNATPKAGEAVLKKSVEICVRELEDW